MPPSDAPPQRFRALPGIVSGLCGLASLALGVAVLAGWHTGNAFLISMREAFLPMQYSTALCFILSGIGLTAAALRLPRLVAAVCGGLSALAGLATAAGYFLGKPSGLEALLSHLPWVSGLPTKGPSLPSALGFSLAGTGILLLGLKLLPSVRRPLIWVLGSSSMALGAMALCAYKMGVNMIVLSGGSVGVPVHAAVGMVALGIGLLATQWDGEHKILEDRWLPVPLGFGTIVAALLLWQALTADRAWALRKQADVIAQNVASDAVSRFTFSIRALNRIKLRWEKYSGDPVYPYPEWYSDARDCLADEPVFEGIGRTDAAWKVNWAELGQDAGPLLGKDFHAETRWGAETALQETVRIKRMFLSPVHAVRGEDLGFLIFLPMYREDGTFTGFTFGVFRLLDLKKSSLDQPAFTTCRISVFAEGTFILGELPQEPEGEKVRGEYSVKFRGHVWRFVAEPRTSAMSGGTLPAMVLWLGILLGGAVFAAVWGLQQTRLKTRLALSANDRLTGEITEREQAERSLKESEARLGVVLDSATGVAVIAFDLQGGVTYFSRGAEQLLGWKAAELLGKDAVSMIHDPAEVEERARILTAELGTPVSGFETFSAIPRRRGSERGEWTYIRRDGSRRVVDLVVTMLRDEAGGPPMGLLSTAIDITERQQMERDLRDSLLAKKAAQSLLESAGRIARLGHWELPLDGRGPVWSDITCAIHEVPAGTRVDLGDAIKFYHPDDQKRIGEGVEQALARGTMFDIEARLITAKGHQVWVHSRGETVRDENGTITALQGVIQDIDQRHQVEELLRQRNSLLEEATARAEEHARAKTEFLANMSHEIRTPLNAVIGMSELLMTGDLDRRERELVETIHSSGDVLLGLINDILDFTKIESGQLELERIPVPVRDCVESVLDLLAGQAAEKKLELMSRISAEVPQTIIGDPIRLRQVLVNLVGNALKFTEEGEVLVELNVCQENKGAVLECAVTDTGIGIAPGQQDRLFNAFSQVDASMTRRFGGTGLGLAICHRLIQHMGGSIRVDSEEDKGSSFRFRIPLEPIALPAPGLDQKSAAEAAAGGGVCRPHAFTPVPQELAGKTVLVAAANGTLRRILSAQLKEWSMPSAACATAAEAMERLNGGEGGGFDLLIVDAALLSGNGAAFSEEIHRHPASRNLPVLLLTSVGDRGRDLKPESRSASLTKPVKTGLLLTVLRNLLTVSPAAPAKSAEKPPAARELPGTSRPLRILVAEDNPVNQRVVALHLQRMGYQPSLAANGQEALDAVLREAFDVILLDVQMPVMDGLEAAREICRQCPPDVRPWTIALTANAFGSDRDQCLEAGMNDYLSKPVRSETLERALKSAWEARSAAA